MKQPKLIDAEQDLTEFKPLRRPRETEAKLLQAISSAIRESPDFDTTLTVALSQVREATGWHYGEAWLPNSNKTALEFGAASCDAIAVLQQFQRLSRSFKFFPGVGLPGRVWMSQKPEWIQNAAQAPHNVFLRNNLAIAAGLGAGLGVPIVERGQVIAVLVFFMFASRPEDQTLVELVAAVTAQLGPILQLKQAELALCQAEAKYRSIFENAVEGIFQTTPDGRYLTANPMLAKIYGYDSPAELLATLTDIRHQLYVDPQSRVKFMQLIQQQDAVWGFESQIYRKDGSVIWISESARTIRDEQGWVVAYEGTVEDITHRKHTEAELYKRERLLQGVAEATRYLLTNPDYEAAIAQALAALGKAAEVDRVYIYENHPHPETGAIAMSMRFEWTREAIAPIIDQPYWQNQPYEAFGLERWYAALSQGQSVNEVTRELPAATQALLYRDQTLAILLVPILIDNQFWGYIGFDDCTHERHWSKSEESILIAMATSIAGALKREQAAATIRYQAFHDLLTGLPNRICFHNCLLPSLTQAQARQHMGAVMFLDLDRFKTINDTLGHAVGDRLLQQVAHRLASCLREGDVVARWGGDEFTLLLPQIHGSADAQKIAQRLLQALKPAFLIDAHALHVTSSIGIALYPQDGADVSTLLRNADVALYKAKDQGRNNFQFYTSVPTS